MQRTFVWELVPLAVCGSAAGRSENVVFEPRSDSASRASSSLNSNAGSSNMTVLGTVISMYMYSYTVNIQR